jgi:hypothetical protein
VYQYREGVCRLMEAGRKTGELRDGPIIRSSKPDPAGVPEGTACRTAIGGTVPASKEGENWNQ